MEVFRVLGTKSTTFPDSEPPKRLSRKEFARQFRHEAYLRAKKFRQTDPRQIALKEKFKEQRREASRAFYALHSNSNKALRAKERKKAYRDEIKKAAEKQRREAKRPTHYTVIRIRPSGKAVRQNKLMGMVVRGSSFENKLKG